MNVTNVYLPQREVQCVIEINNIIHTLTNGMYLLPHQRHNRRKTVVKLISCDK